MDNIFEVLKANYEFVFMGIGAFILLGAIMNWKWLVNPNSSTNKTSLEAFVIRNFGAAGYRVLMGLLGLLLLGCGAVFFVLGR